MGRPERTQRLKQVPTCRSTGQDRCQGDATVAFLQRATKPLQVDSKTPYQRHTEKTDVVTRIECFEDREQITKRCRVQQIGSDNDEWDLSGAELGHQLNAMR